MHFASIQALKAQMLNVGINEMKGVTSYQVMHKHSLFIAVQINQYAIDK